MQDPDPDADLIASSQDRRVDSGFLRDRLDRTRLRTVKVGQIRTRVYEAGEGEPLLLIHGGQFGSLYSLDCWSLNLDALAESFHVFAFDKLGQGHTDPPTRGEDYVLEAVETHVKGVVDALGLDSFHVLGHSRGGVPALRLAFDRPSDVRSLVLVSTGSVAPFDPAIPVGAFYAPFELDAGVEWPTRQEVMREARAQAINSGWITDDFATRMTDIARLETQRKARDMFRAVEQHVWRPSLAATRADNLATIDATGIQCPTLLLWGYEDRSAPRRQGIRLYDRVAAKTRDAEFVMLTRAGHYVFRDRPDEFLRVVTGFCLGTGG